MFDGVFPDLGCGGKTMLLCCGNNYLVQKHNVVLHLINAVFADGGDQVQITDATYCESAVCACFFDIADAETAKAVGDCPAPAVQEHAGAVNRLSCGVCNFAADSVLGCRLQHRCHQ